MGKQTENKDIHTTISEDHSVSDLTKVEGALLEINGTLLIMAISFLIFTVVMQKTFYSPLIKIREKRKQFIKNIKDSVDYAVSKSEELSLEYTEKIKRARKNVSDNTLSSIAEANQEKMKIINEKKQDITQFLEQERKSVQEQKAQSLENLKHNIEGYATEIFRKVLEEDITVAMGEKYE